MADHITCPHCSKSIVPVEKWVVVWKKGVFKKNTTSWAEGGVIGLLIFILGIVLFVVFRVTSVGLAGVAAAMVGCLILAGLVLRYLRLARSKQRRQVCPLCKHNWAGQLRGESATESLESYFTDVELLRGEFEELIVAPTLARRLLIVHGVGGVGKSSLLRMFRLSCRKKNIPVALSSGDEAKSQADILTDWAKDLTLQGIALPTFTRTVNEYRTIQRKVEERANVDQKAQNEAGKKTMKLALQTVGGIAGFIPVVGPALSIAMGGTSDTLVEWLHAFLNKEEIDLLLDPTDELTDSFLNDLVDAIQAQGSKAARRIVLLLDTLEQIEAMTKWVCDFAQRLHANVLLVFAGRMVPGWDRQWPGWTTQAKIEELRPMTEDVMRSLIRRYYATQRDGTPDPKQVEAIIHFARGLPVAGTNIVQLWVQYGAKDFYEVRAQVVADLVDQLTRGIPERVRPVLKAAAVLRWFNKELLAVVGGEGAISDEVYEELRRFPVVRPRKEGLALHDSVREHLDDNMRVHEPARHREMHQRAADYFEAQLQGVARGEEATDLALEVLYHKILANEEEGIGQFRKVAEELVRYQLLAQLRTLLNDVNNYPLQKKNSRLWWEYYRARLRDLEGRPGDAVPLYKMIADDDQAEKLLCAYALCDWAWIERYKSLENTAQILERVGMLFPEPDMLSEPDAKLGFYLLEMGELNKDMGKEVLPYYERARNLYEKIGDTYWLAFTYNRIKYYYLDGGRWQDALKVQKRGLLEVAKLAGEQQQSYLRAEFLGGNSIDWMFAGRYRETEQNLQEALRITEKFERGQQRLYFLRDLGLAQGLQGKVREATPAFEEGIEIEKQQSLDPLYEAVAWAFQGMVAMRWIGADEAERYLTMSLNRIRQETENRWPLLTCLSLYGRLHEVKGDADRAEQAYREGLNLPQIEQWGYWHSAILAGLVRVHYVRGERAAFYRALREAEDMAQRYEHNDHLAMLRLTQGHLTWDDQDTDKVQRFEDVLHYYQQALLYALRHNRFLLDEILSARPHAMPLQALIPRCLERGEEGMRMLLALREWWQGGTNDTGTARPDTISYLSENMPLQEAERLARRQEPGDGSVQQTVLEQLQVVLH